MSGRNIATLCTVGPLAHKLLCEVFKPRTAEGKFACIAIGVFLALPFCED